MSMFGEKFFLFFRSTGDTFVTCVTYQPTLAPPPAQEGCGDVTACIHIKDTNWRGRIRDVNDQRC